MGWRQSTSNFDVPPRMSRAMAARGQHFIEHGSGDIPMQPARVALLLLAGRELTQHAAIIVLVEG